MLKTLALLLVSIPALSASAQTHLSASTVSVAEQPAAEKNPTFLFRSISTSEEWDHLANGNTLTTTVGYTEPFRNASLAAGVSIPFVYSNETPGPAQTTMGDVAVKGQWIPYETMQHGVLLTGTLTTPTQTGSLGAGKWRLTPSASYAHFWGPHFLLAQFVKQQFSVAGPADKAQINRTDLDLYGVYSSHNLRWWINSDLNLRVDEANQNHASSTASLSYGQGIRKAMGGSLNGSVQVAGGVGRGRPYNTMVLVSMSLVGF